MRKHLLPAAGLLSLVALLFGFSELFQARFAKGDGYPAYSSYRADPKGARALYAVYSELSDQPVSRNLTPLVLLDQEDVADATFVRFGQKNFELPDTDVEKLEALATAGARIVIAKDTINYLPSEFDTADLTPPDPDEEEEEELETNTTDIREKWGFDITYLELEDDVKTLNEARPEGGWRITGSGEPPARWYTPARITDTTVDWQIFASAEGRPVAIERKWGDGSIVILTGSYFASNESLSLEPPTPFLQYIFGATGSRPIIFDETQLGTVIQPSIIGLVYRYNLGGALLGFACVLGFYIWKNSSPLVKPDSEAEARRYADASIRGSDAATGLVRLIRRHVPQKSLLSTALRTWKNAAARRKIGNATPEAISQAESLIADQENRPARERDLTGTYNQLVSLLNPSRK